MNNWRKIFSWNLRSIPLEVGGKVKLLTPESWLMRIDNPRIEWVKVPAGTEGTIKRVARSFCLVDWDGFPTYAEVHGDVIGLDDAVIVGWSVSKHKVCAV